MNNFTVISKVTTEKIKLESGNVPFAPRQKSKATKIAKKILKGSQPASSQPADGRQEPYQDYNSQDYNSRVQQPPNAGLGGPQ